jgi:hypothetical protein
MFDWSWLDLERWTPLSHLGAGVVHIVGGLHAAGPCTYVLTNTAFGSIDDPGIGGFLWARSRVVAMLIYERQARETTTESGSLCPPPPQTVLGFAPLTFGAVITHARARGDSPQVSATYAFPDGIFVSSEVRTADREFIFASENPDVDEDAIAVRFDLPVASSGP